MKDKKERIISFLGKNGRSATSRIAFFIKSDIWSCRKYLNLLEKEGKILKENETRGTFWSLR